MSSSISKLAFVLAIGAAALACRKEEPVGITETTSATQVRPSLAEEDRAFVEKVVQSGMLEVALGEHVNRRAASTDVRAYGQQMVTAHSLAEEELTNIASARGVNVPLQMDADHRATYDRLATLRGKKLDREYADLIIEDHARDVRELKVAAATLQDPELRAWAAKTLPAWESDLEKAKALEGRPE